MENTTSPLLALTQQIQQTLIGLGILAAILYFLRQAPSLYSAWLEAQHQERQNKLAEARQQQDERQQQRKAILELIEKSDWKKSTEGYQAKIWNLFLTDAQPSHSTTQKPQ